MNAPLRRGACPGLSAPMATGDGLLARLTPAGSTISFDAFSGLCAAARAHGNGIVEVTSRGSIQFRGLSATSAPIFAAEVAALGIEGSDGIPVLANPLCGLDPGETFNAGPIAAALRMGLATARFASRLAAKVSVVVDGGGALHLDDVAADVRLRAMDGGGYLHLSLGGDAATAVPLGAVALERTVECVLRLFEELASIAPHARMRDALRGDGLSAFKSAVASLVVEAPAPAVRPAAEPFGVHPLRSGNAAVGVGLPFGHSDSGALQRLIDTGRRAGATGLRTAPGRVLLVLGLPSSMTQNLAADAAALGFIVDADDPRRRVIACAGAPVCASGQIPARAMAPDIARIAGALLRPGDVIHVSGCAKGCAHPAATRLAVFGRDGGCDVYVDGVLSCSVKIEALPERIEKIVRSRAEADHG